MSAGVIRICCGPYESLAYLVVDDSGNAALIDAGPPAEEILNVLGREGASLKLVLLTHTHFDHIAGLQGLSEHLDVRALAHEEDISVLSDFWPLNMGPPPDLKPLDGIVKVGSLSIEPIHTPGHTPGSVCYYVRELGAVFTGDTLFKGNIGRTDFKHGSPERMKESLLKLMELPSSTAVLPGHGEPTTIGAERANLEEYLGWLGA